MKIHKPRSTDTHLLAIDIYGQTIVNNISKKIYKCDLFYSDGNSILDKIITEEYNQNLSLFYKEKISLLLCVSNFLNQGSVSYENLMHYYADLKILYKIIPRCIMKIEVEENPVNIMAVLKGSLRSVPWPILTNADCVITRYPL